MAAAQPAVSPASYNIITVRSDPDLGLSEVRNCTTPGDYATSDGAATASLRTAPFTLLTAHATTDGDGTVTGAAAGMRYSFLIVAAPGTRVAATFTADMVTRGVGQVLDEATVGLSAFSLYSFDLLGSFHDSEGSASFTGPSQSLRHCCGTFHFDTPVSFVVDANAQYRVELIASAQTATTGVVVDASIDPVITIDPAYQGA